MEPLPLFPAQGVIELTLWAAQDCYQLVDGFLLAAQ
jgi:hypothetical protein